MEKLNNDIILVDFSMRIKIVPDDGGFRVKLSISDCLKEIDITDQITDEFAQIILKKHLSHE